MKDTVEVIINPDGKSCTTLNPLGNSAREYHASRYGTELFWFDSKNKWQQAESERKTHEIANAKEIANIIRFKPGTTHKAQIINNKAVIL